MIAEVFHDAALVESSIATTSTYGSVSIDIWNIVEEWFLIMILFDMILTIVIELRIYLS